MSMGEYSFSLSDTHASDLMLFMEQQRKEKDVNLCDVCFIVGNDCVYAHRSILAVSSAYFQGLLSGAFSETQGDGGTRRRMMEMDLTGSVSNIVDVDTLLSAMYTGILKLSDENITGVTELACFFLVESVRSICENFMLEALNLNNCLYFLKMGFHYDLTELFQASRQLLQFRFHDYYIHHPDMLTVPAQCLESLSKIYKYTHQQDILQFLAKWVEEGADATEHDSREVRLNTASRILNVGVLCLKSEDLDLKLLKGNKDVLSHLLGKKCTCTQYSDTSEFHSAETSKVGECCEEDVSICGTDISKSEGGVSGTCGISSQAGVTEKDNEETPSGGTKREDKEIPAGVIKKEDKEITVSSVANKEAPSGHDTQQTSISENDVSRSNVNSSNCDDRSSSHGRDSQSDSKSSSSSFNASDTSEKNISGVGASHCHHSLKRDLGETSHLSDWCKEKRCRLSAESSLDTDSNLSSFDEDSLCDVLVTFVPREKVVSFCTATDCLRCRPRSCAMELEVCLYHVRKKRWLWVGRATFPERYEERDSWKVACVNCKAYFISLFRKTLHVLDLNTWTWNQLDCNLLCLSIGQYNRIRSLLPISVNNTLYVLVSDKEWHYETQHYKCNQCYYMLDKNDQWKPVGEAEHFHSATPLSCWSVSDGKVYVVKATIAINVENSVRIVHEGHILDCAKGEVSQFCGTTYATSPMRVLVRNGEVHIVDGESQHSQMNFEAEAWDDRGKVDLSDIKIGRSTSGESYHPCWTNSSCTMGSSVWELYTKKHHSALTELRLDEKGNMFTVRHPPPPFRYITIMTACQLSTKFVSALKTCHYLHKNQVS